jgi:hypothetical protein
VTGPGIWVAAMLMSLRPLASAGIELSAAYCKIAENCKFAV